MTAVSLPDGVHVAGARVAGRADSVRVEEDAVAAYKERPRPRSRNTAY